MKQNDCIGYFEMQLKGLQISFIELLYLYFYFLSENPGNVCNICYCNVWASGWQFDQRPRPSCAALICHCPPHVLCNGEMPST